MGADPTTDKTREGDTKQTCPMHFQADLTTLSISSYVLSCCIPDSILTGIESVWVRKYQTCLKLMGVFYCNEVSETFCGLGLISAQQTYSIAGQDFRRNRQGSCIKR